MCKYVRSKILFRILNHRTYLQQEEKEENKNMKNYNERLGSSKVQISWVPCQEAKEAANRKDATRRNAQGKGKREEQCMVMHEHVTCKK